MQIKTYKEALEKVFKIEQTRDYSLEKVKKANILLNNPLKNIKIIHIAWTNWKWSVSNMVFSVLKNAWKKVWVFTSPHLIDLKERFLTDTWEITEKEFVEILNKILELDIKLSFFEKCTLIAFLLFEKRKVEYWVVEVGLWWLLDSTNIVNPIITAITSIWIDHTDFLWNSFEEISYQKAWIIKSWVPIVYNHKNNIIEKVAKENKSPIIFTDKKIKTNLIWEYQEKNAWIAYEICKYLKIPEKKILEWLQKVKHFWRLQYVTENLLIDWAHNKDWLIELKKYLDNLNKHIKLCFSLKKWKSPKNVLEVFWKEEYILIDSKNKIIVEEPEILKDKILKYWDFDLQIKTPKEVFKESQENKDILYVIFGSLYMIWEFLEIN